MKWRKIKLLIDPSLYAKGGYSYASVPFVGLLRDDRLIVFFTVRDQLSRSHLAYAVFSLPGFELLELFERPIFYPSLPGFFDSDGVMGNQVLKIGSEIYLYYTGWNKGTSVPFRNAIGLAKISLESMDVKRLYQGPIMDRSPYDASFVATPHVIPWQDKFLMYYLSCDGWFSVKGKIQHRYNIKIAISEDALHWKPTGRIAIDYRDEHEYAISTPRVILDGKLYKMWFSHRATRDIPTYRIGYAESHDGLNWIRKDHEVGIDVSLEGWDSEMICYPYVFDYNGNRFMLYNGNGYGRTGFGLAILEQD